MREETWYKIYCDNCGVVNWLCDGDTNDLTKPDIEGLICRSCNFAKSFQYEGDIAVCGKNDPEDYEVGLEKPE